MARVCLGGTFDPFHVGHQALLSRAIEEAGPGGSVFVGLVADPYSASKRDRDVAPFSKRQARIQAWWTQQDTTTTLALSGLTDKHGPSATGDYDVIVASAETAATAHAINQVRASNGLAALKVSVIPYVLGDDLLPISGTRIAAGLIDKQGRRRAPLAVAVGSTNPVKLDAVRRAFDGWLPGVSLEVRPVVVDSGVADQPWGDATIRGADNRARAALDADPAAEYAVGLEAGLFADPTDGRVLDVQHCVILDRHGFRTHGHGGGFAYPPAVVQALRRPGRTVTDVLGPLAADPELGKTTGAIGFLTGGRLDRRRLSEQAVEAALVPRVRRDLYLP